MGVQRTKDTQITFTVNSLVYMARNDLALKAIEGEYDYILWLDSDMVFQPDILNRMLEVAKTGKEYVSALCFTRKFPTKPVICKKLEWSRADNGNVKMNVELYEDYPKDEVFEIEGGGFGACLTSVNLIKKIAEQFRGSPFDPLPSFGEDYSFCWRVKQVEEKMWCDSSIKVGHVGKLIFDENIYLGQEIK